MNAPVHAKRTGGVVIDTIIQSDDLEVIVELRNWLSREDALRGRIRLIAQPLDEGNMGGVTDVLAVALATGGAGTTFVHSVTTWIRQRKSDVTIKVTAPDGRSVEIDTRRVSDPLTLLDQLFR